MIDAKISKRNVMSTKRQKSLILTFLASNKGQMFTENEIQQALLQFFREENPVPKRAVIAIRSPSDSLTELEKEGLIKKSVISMSGESKFYYYLK
jgi:hypothetical protein